MAINREIRRSVTILVCSLLLGACVAATVGTLGATAVVTTDVLHERRTVGEYIDDETIEIQIGKYLLANQQIREQTRLRATSMNGVVLLTGQARNAKLKNRVVHHIEGIDGVQQVLGNYVKIGGVNGFASTAHDAWLTTKVKTALFAGTGLDANRVKVVTEQSTVYLMGLVTQAEAQQAVEVVRRVDGVKLVVKAFEIME